ncbi:unnamed protein product [Thlaspi arvense]|uniref:Peptidase C1A papain C-terminal domain-containing protein n=1 Tax=Thlaspi arvense TaxID=13288 RepID=A0AAU9SH86_THLAR|nr:unnamed protein product [Thlaspi arvense]
MRKPYKLKLNMFANLSAYEFSKAYTCTSKVKKDYEMIVASHDPRVYENKVHPPDSVDWRKNGAVTDGVLTTANCGTKLTHAMTVVGYGLDPDGIKYWIVKNSHGSKWGEGGYIRIERGIADPKGRCGIAMDPVYPLKSPVR